jgi:membrane protein implicated in regulation of membrane protease activity
MDVWITWFVLAGVVVIMEIATGTFYLLMIAIGAAAGGFAALAGLSSLLQCVIAAGVGISATWALRQSKFGKFNKTDAATDPNVNIDIGQTLMIAQWNDNDGADATARAMYRGAMWDIQLAGGATARPGRFVIREIQGSRLIVTNEIQNT